MKARLVNGYRESSEFGGEIEGVLGRGKLAGKREAADRAIFSKPLVHP